MKNKILLRLILYFASSFVIFALIIGIVFSALFSNHNIEVHKAELERQALSIANAFAEILEEDTGCGRGGGMGMRRGMRMMEFYTYLQFVEGIVQCSAWIVDRDLNQITFGHRPRHMQHMQMNINTADLPYYAESVILNAFEGRSSTGESFSEFLGIPSITAAAPVK